MDDDYEKLSGIELWEMVTAQGFRKVGGKHVATGPTSRNGYRRILPAKGDDFWHENVKPEQVDSLHSIAREVRRGRNAAVFDALVLAPLRNEPKRTVKDLAAQYGVPEARIHRIMDDCRTKVKKRQAVVAAGGDVTDTFEAQVMKGFVGERCSLCARVFIWELLPECNGVFGDDTTRRPECLEAQRRTIELGKQLEEARAKDRALWKKN
jgi:hypothetical protein